MNGPDTTVIRSTVAFQPGRSQVSCNMVCVTLDPKIKETTQTTNQIKCEWALTHPLSNSHTLKQVAVGYYKESWGKQDLLWV